MNVTFLGNAPSLGIDVFDSVATGATVYYYYGTSGWSSTYGGLPTAELDAPPFTYTTNSDTITITGYTGSGGAVTIPDTINGYSVTSIAENAFVNCTNLTGITIGNSVTNIGVGAFLDCRSLTSVTIGNSVTNIEESAFKGCTNLTSVTMGNSVTSLGEEAFGFCSSLTSVTIPNSVTNLADVTFYDCTSLTNVTFLGNAPGLGIDVFTGVAAGATVYYYYGNSGWSSTYGGLPTVELDAPNPPQIGNGSIGVSSGNFSFTVTGVTNQTIIVEASTNLVNWQPVWTNTLSGTNAIFTDPQWTNYSSRFYQVQ